MSLRVTNEVMHLRENAEGEVVVLLDEELMRGLDSMSQTTLIRSVFIMATDQLVRDIEDNPSGLVEVSPDPKLSEAVSAVSMLVDSYGLFNLLVQFGGRVNPETTLVDGLLHVMGIVQGIREEMLGE